MGNVLAVTDLAAAGFKPAAVRGVVMRLPVAKVGLRNVLLVLLAFVRLAVANGHHPAQKIRAILRRRLNRPPLQGLLCLIQPL